MRTVDSAEETKQADEKCLSRQCNLDGKEQCSSFDSYILKLRFLKIPPLVPELMSDSDRQDDIVTLTKVWAKMNIMCWIYSIIIITRRFFSVDANILINSRYNNVTTLWFANHHMNMFITFTNSVKNRDLQWNPKLHSSPKSQSVSESELYSRTLTSIFNLDWHLDFRLEFKQFALHSQHGIDICNLHLQSWIWGNISDLE